MLFVACHLKDRVVVLAQCFRTASSPPFANHAHQKLFLEARRVCACVWALCYFVAPTLVLFKKESSWLGHGVQTHAESFAHAQLLERDVVADCSAANASRLRSSQLADVRVGRREPRCPSARDTRSVCWVLGCRWNLHFNVCVYGYAGALSGVIRSSLLRVVAAGLLRSNSGSLGIIGERCDVTFCPRNTRRTAITRSSARQCASNTRLTQSFTKARHSSSDVSTYIHTHTHLLGLFKLINVIRYPECC